ncbi:hypothetical protein [Aureispira anguillae]|uniref:hypothetical protein n=1 Tax=Aureispira anguillae TaxID=2864201 RepID=UPI00222EAC2B|nr:hypothetical protein [Aureispira anguillae]
MLGLALCSSSILDNDRKNYKVDEGNDGNNHLTLSMKQENYSVSSRYGYVKEGIIGYVFKKQIPNTVPLTRFYSQDYSDHFYTASSLEIDHVNNNLKTYKNEGVIGYVYLTPVQGTVPVHRFNLPGEDHFYTTSEYESNHVKKTGSYTSEGISCWVYPSKNGNDNLIPVYRLYSHEIIDHFYTTSAGEVDIILDDSHNFNLWDYLRIYRDDRGYWIIENEHNDISFRVTIQWTDLTTKTYYVRYRSTWNTLKNSDVAILHKQVKL